MALRSLKTALMCHGETQWTDTLPVVLFGLRTCLKEDLDASVAELVYDTTLKVPGEFFSSEEMPNDPRIFVEDFHKATDVLWINHTPHKVLERISDKVFAIEIDGKCINATVDRLM